MQTEIFLAFVSNLRIVFAVLAGFLIVIAFGNVAFIDTYDKDEKARYKKRITQCIYLAMACVFLCAIPNVDDIWHVRIALVKYSLASPENVAQATETIERIGHKLECKYLGGDACVDKK